MVIKGVVFDMDDTLYLERDYVRSGFKAVASHVATVADKDKVFTCMWTMFEDGVRGDTFNRLMHDFPAVAEHFEIPELVEVYRSHQPDISIIPEMKELILTLKGKGVALGVLSDGPLISQQAKADALGVEALVGKTMLTDALGRENWKPNTTGFELLATSLNVPHNTLVYVGDNPVKDFIAPKKLGWLAIRLRMSGQLRENEEAVDGTSSPHEDVHSISQLSKILGV